MILGSSAGRCMQTQANPHDITPHRKIPTLKSSANASMLRPKPPRPLRFRLGRLGSLAGSFQGAPASWPAPPFYSCQYLLIHGTGPPLLLPGLNSRAAATTQQAKQHSKQAVTWR